MKIDNLKIKQKHTKTHIYKTHKMIKMEPNNVKKCDKQKSYYKQQTSYNLYIF